MSRDELLFRLPKLIDRDEAKEEFDELVKMRYIYNHGKHSHALTDLGFMACMELMKRRKTEWKKQILL